MARKEIITKEKILETAFALTRADGIEHVTARKLAAQIGCSTQPIFRIYANMNELYKEIYQKAHDTFGDYYENYRSDVDIPWMRLGLAYINFAKEEEKLFRLLFQSTNRESKNIFELLAGKLGPGYGNTKKLCTELWIFIYGCACMVLADDFSLSEDEIIELLRDVYNNCSENQNL